MYQKNRSNAHKNFINGEWVKSRTKNAIQRAQIDNM
jgi:hypothetical protein